MSDTIAKTLGLPPIDQVAYLVHDMEKALQTFEPLFGPFQRMESALKDTLYRGRRVDLTLDIAFGKSGDLEIELIAVKSGEGPHREVLETRGEGIHHIRFRVDSIEAPLERLRGLGFHPIWEHEMPEIGVAWAYLEGPSDQGSALIELLQMPA